MSNVGLTAMMVAAFALAIGLVALLSRLIDAGAPGDDGAGLPRDISGASQASTAHGMSLVTGPRPLRRSASPIRTPERSRSILASSGTARPRL